MNKHIDKLIHKLNVTPKDLTDGEKAELIAEEQRLLDSVKQYKDFCSDLPDIFPAIPKLLKKVAE